MPTLVNYSGNNKRISLCSIDSTCFFSVRPSKRLRISDPYILLSNTSIEILPDECLYEIFRRLPDGQSRSTSACVSKHWLMVLSNIRNSEFKVIEESSNNDEQQNDGYLTRSLEGKKATDTRLAAIAIGTSARGGLGKLSLRGSTKVTSVGFSAIAHGCPFLKILSLWNLPLIGDESLIEISKECHSLESLDLSQCPLFSNLGLASIAKNCPNLSSLTLESCKNIGNESLQAVAQNCPNLQYITIKDCPLIEDQGITTLLSSSLTLTKIKLLSLNITDFSLAVIGRFGNSITNLALLSLRNVTQKGFWAMGNAKNLKSLMFLTVNSCNGVTDLSLEAIGQGCPSLKHMILKKCCFLSDRGLFSFIESAQFLESLQLEECNRITQHGIVGALSNGNTKLKSLSLVKCMGIKELDQEQVDFFESQTLRSLTIKNCIGFGNTNLAMIAKLCPYLHNLDLTGLYRITDTGLFEFLKTCKVGLLKVNLTNWINLTDKVVVDLVKIHGPTLEELNLEGCIKISDESLAAISKNCILLKDLDVSKCCITDSGVSCLSKGNITRAEDDEVSFDHFAVQKEANTIKDFDESTLFSPYTKQEWRSYQEKKINEGRKTQLHFKATYANNTAIKGAKLYITQLTSDFHWGCGMTHRILNNPDYKKWFASKFTAADFHNELKWYYTEPTQGHENYTDPDAMIKFADENGIVVRGHTVLWDDVKYQQKWVKKLSPEKLLQAANKRVDSVVKRYKGRLIGWDVMNENLHHNFFEKRLGKNASSYFYSRVYNIDPNTTLYMNEFNTTEHVNDKWAAPKKYLRKLKEIQSYNGNNDMKMGIGLECHYGAEPIDLHYVRSTLSLLSQTGLPIWLTELDVKIDPMVENKTLLQVVYLEEILRESFSHAAVKAIIIWTGASIDGCDIMCMTNEKLENTPVGDVIDKLMEEWRTGNIEGEADSNGKFQVTVFNGRYEVTVVDPFTNASTRTSFKVDKVSIPDKNVHLQILV